MGSAFDRAVALARQDDGSLLGQTSPDYANMVGPYGGITAAQALHAVLLQPDLLGEPVAVTVNFCAALADGPYLARARALRTNRSTQHWFAELVQDGQTVISATAVTAARRPSWSSDEHRMPAAPPPEQCPAPQGRGFVTWLQRYEMRLVEGSLPSAWDDSEQPHSMTRMWVRDAPPRPLDHVSLMALCDVFFPRVWQRRATRVPVGTVSMTVYFHADAGRLAATGEGYLFAQAQGQGFRGGFFDQTAQLWNQQGELLATTHQVVYFKS
jgi:acyl-CoA thioesterase